MFYGFAEPRTDLSGSRDQGLRMNSELIRPRRLAADLAMTKRLPQMRDLLVLLPKRLPDLEDLAQREYIWKARTVASASLIWPAHGASASPDRCGAHRVAHDLRRANLLRYETYDFDVIPPTRCVLTPANHSGKEMRESIN